VVSSRVTVPEKVTVWGEVEFLQEKRKRKKELSILRKNEK